MDKNYIAYVVEHAYDVDGGFGDAVEKHKVIAVFSDKNKALSYIKRWSKPRIYDDPYAPLEEHRLILTEVPIDIPIKQKPEW